MSEGPENSLLREEMTIGQLKADVAWLDALKVVDGDKRLRATWVEALCQVLHPESRNHKRVCSMWLTRSSRGPSFRGSSQHA